MVLVCGVLKKLWCHIFGDRVEEEGAPGRWNPTVLSEGDLRNADAEPGFE